MSHHTYKIIEITGTSPNSQEEAVNSALSRAARTVKHMRWFQVQESRGAVDPVGKVEEWQVTLKVGFTLETGDS